MINKKGIIVNLVSSMKMFHHQEEILNDTKEESVQSQRWSRRFNLTCRQVQNVDTNETVRIAKTWHSYNAHIVASL